VKIRTIFVSVATVGLMVGPAFVHGVVNSVAGAKAECTIKGTAADDNLNGTTRQDVICTGAGQDTAFGLEGADVIRLGQGDDVGGGGDGSDIVKGQADDDQVCGNGQNDKLYGGQGDDNLGSNAAVDGQFVPGQSAGARQRLPEVAGSRLRQRPGGRWPEHRHLRARRRGHELPVREVRS